MSMEDTSQGNTGYSGTPFWKLRQSQAVSNQALEQAAQTAALLKQQQSHIGKVDLGRRILADGVVMPADKGRPMVRHVLVRDLRKVAVAMCIPLPQRGLFDDGGGERALFALFDGQLSASPGPRSPEWCCKNLPVKLLKNLSSMPNGAGNAALVKASLLKSFGDLQRDLSEAGIEDRCSASIVLVIGDWLFSAVCGSCGAVLCEDTGYDVRGGGAGGGGGAPPGSKSRTPAYASTSLAASGADGAVGVLEVKGTPFGDIQVRGIQLQPDGRGVSGPFIILSGTLATKVFTEHRLMEIGVANLWRPRAASGEIAAAAARRGPAGGEVEPSLTDSAAVVVFFRKLGEEGGTPELGPPAKRLKVDQQVLESVRVRHILVRHKDVKQPLNPLTNKPITRSRDEAEALLRGALAELARDGDHGGDSMWAVKSTPRILSVCRAHSECKSALKGGSNCGDLGWLGKKELRALGNPAFEEAVRSLPIAEWSDLLFSQQGVHLMMRIA